MVKMKEDGLENMEWLGKGSYSVVLKAVWSDKSTSTRTRQEVAIKIVDTRHGSDYVNKFLPREIEIVRQLNHPCVLRFPKVYERTAFSASPVPFVTFLTELCEGGDLLKKIKRLKKMQEWDSKITTRQIVEGLMYLLAKDIIHRDLKCENIFLDKAENVKIGDFGFARVLKDNEKSNTFCGSRAYVAPEILRTQAYSGQTADVWSVGVVLFIMCTGAMPFDARNPNKMVEKQLSHKLKFPRAASDLSAEGRSLIMGMLHPYPASRMTYKKIVESDWLKDTKFQIRTEVPVRQRA